MVNRAKDSYWVGSNAYLDEKLGTGSQDYSLRLIRKFTGADALVVIDMDISAVLDILKSIDFDKTGTIGLVTADGKEIISGVQGNNAKAIFTDKDFYRESTASKETNKAYYVKINGKENLFIYSKLGETGAMVCAVIQKVPYWARLTVLSSLPS